MEARYAPYTVQSFVTVPVMLFSRGVVNAFLLRRNSKKRYFVERSRVITKSEQASSSDLTVYERRERATSLRVPSPSDPRELGSCEPSERAA